jgi:outer membrane protein assembly factor BamB
MGWSPFRKTGLSFHMSASFKGYTLVTPMGSDSTYLIDMDGQIVHRWLLQGLKQAIYAQLLPDGRLLALATDASTPVPAPLPPHEIPAFEQHVRRIGGNANRLVEYDWDGNELWRYENEDMHHDFVRLANGNTLVTEFTELERAFAATVQGGMPVELPHLVADDLVEVDQSGKELRRVHLWQLLDPVADPRCPIERQAEWTHVNSLAVTPAGDILFSARMMSRIGLVSPAGQLTWKYGGDLGHQHHATFLPNGNVQVFDNGNHRVGPPRSAVVEIDPKTSNVVWQYTANPEEQFYSAHISGAHRLPNNNVLVCEGRTGRLFEITRRGEMVWEWTSPFSIMSAQGQNQSWVFRALRYGPDYPGLAGRELNAKKYGALNKLYGLGD